MQAEYEESKRTAQNLKVEYNEKLDNLEVAHELEIDRIKMDHRAKKKLLDEQWSKLEE